MKPATKIIAILFVFALPFIAKSQTGELKGVITSSDGKPVHGVHIELKNGHYNTISKYDGSFDLKKIYAGKDSIFITYVGLAPIRRTIEIINGTPTIINFQMNETEKRLEEVSVSANQPTYSKPVSIGKMPVNPMDLPENSMTISSDVIKNQQAQRLSDIIKNVNGVYLGSSRAGTQETFYARGYNFSSTNMFKNGSRVYANMIPEVSSLESVEVLKGGAAVLYGNVAPGGIVNMVTKKPKFDFGGEASFRTGDFGLIKPTVDVYGPMSKSVAYRVIGTYEQTHSYRDVVFSRKYYVNPSLLFKLGTKTELLIEGDYLKNNFTPDFGTGSVNGNQIAKLPRSTFLGTPWQYNHIQQATSDAVIKHAFNNQWKFNGTVSYQSFTRDYYAVERIQADAAGKWGRPLGRINMDEKFLSGQANLTGEFKTGKVGHTVLMGMDAEHYSDGSYNYDVQGKIYDTINIFDPNAYVPRTDIPVATKISKVNSSINRFGVYVQDLLKISDKLNVLAGVRWSLQESPVGSTTYLANDSIVKTTLLSNNAFSPKVGIVYKPIATLSIFGSYSNSFMLNTGTDVYGNSLKPSIIDQYEAGIKNIFCDGKLTLNLTAYKIVNNNFAQTAQFDKDGNPNNNTNLKSLSGQTTSKGIEVDLAANPVKGMNIMAGYSYNDMRYTKTPNTIGSYIEGQRLVITPANTANGSIFYLFPEGKLKGIKLGASAFYTGKRFGGWNNTIGQAQTNSRMIPVPAFTTIDVSAGYCYRHISLLVKLSNITNTYNYYVHENYSINPIPPRQLIATISYKF